MRRKERIGILVGGGPAPGINSVIHAVVIEAQHHGFKEVVGFYDGFEHLIRGCDHYTWLAIHHVSRIHRMGGSILRTSRANPTASPEYIKNVVSALDQCGITHLITIGGDDTAFAAREVFSAAEGRIAVMHVPKTIDNDLPLPGTIPTFGFETAREIGAKTAMHMLEDARTTNRWFFVLVMGRRAGHLALGIGKASGATITIIPEEFQKGRIGLDDVCAVLEGAIIKRRAMDRLDGLAVIAEGVGEKLDPDELKEIPGVEVEYDPYGHIRLAEMPFAMILKRRVQRRMADRGVKVSIVDNSLGYSMRCADPNTYDIDYTRTLGCSAAELVLRGEAGMVYLEDGRTRRMTFDALRDHATGKTRVRLVDTASEYYRIAREYMIRLEESDFKNTRMLRGLARAAHMSIPEFQKYFEKVAV